MLELWIPLLMRVDLKHDPWSHDRFVNQAPLIKRSDNYAQQRLATRRGTLFVFEGQCSICKWRSGIGSNEFSPMAVGDRLHAITLSHGYCGDVFCGL